MFFKLNKKKTILYPRRKYLELDVEEFASKNILES